MVLTVGLTAFNFVLNFFKLKLSASTAKVKSFSSQINFHTVVAFE